MVSSLAAALLLVTNHTHLPHTPHTHIYPHTGLVSLQVLLGVCALAHYVARFKCLKVVVVVVRSAICALSTKVKLNPFSFVCVFMKRCT